MQTETVLKISNLDKHYGRIHAVRNLSLEIPKGSVFGLLGPNGSGKTTTLGILLDTISKYKGDFTWFGQKSTHKTRWKIGAILENPIFYPYLSAINNLKIVCDIKNISYEEIPTLLELVGLEERGNDKFSTYSLGMKQRLAIAAAMVGDPSVLILDEPTNGLDPQGIADIRDIIKRISRMGVTIILASHLLDEVQKVCSHVAILQKGNLLVSGKVSDVLSDDTTIVVSSSNMDELEFILGDIKEVSSIQKVNNQIQVKLSDDKDTEWLNRSLIDKGIYLNHLSSNSKSLESFFLELLNQNN